MSALGPNQPNPVMDVLTDLERTTYNSFSHRLESITDDEHRQYDKLRKEIQYRNTLDENGKIKAKAAAEALEKAEAKARIQENERKGGKSRRNPSKKRPTARHRRRSSKRKVRKARTTRRKY